MFPPAHRSRRVLALALPIIGGMISQNLLNLVDTAFVSDLGDTALAAVGQGSFANFAIFAFVAGLAPGVQAMAARRQGEGSHAETAVPLNGGLLLAIGFGAPLAAVTYLVAPSFFPVLTNDPTVAALGTTYLSIRLLGTPAVGMNFAFRGYWNAIDRPAYYLRTLLVMHVINATLDYGLIFGRLGLPELGVEGAALASLIATWCGTVLYFAQGFVLSRGHGFLRGVPSPTVMITMLRTSLPAAVQQFLFAAGMSAFFAIVASLGTGEVAATSVLVTLLLVAILPGVGFGLASASLVGQALGAGDADQAKRWGWDTIRVAVPLIAAVASVGLFAPQLVLGFFLTTPETLTLAVWPMRVIALTLPLDVAGMVLLNSLLGAGDSVRVLVVSVAAQWFFFLPLAFLVGPVFGAGLTAIWIANAAYRLLQSGIFAVLWQGGRWSRIKV